MTDDERREDEKRRREAAQASVAEVEPGGHEVAGRSIKQPAAELYRLSWEMPPAVVIDRVEAQRGPEIWPSYEFDTLTWHRVETITDNPHGQHETLTRWAENHEQPIRNVKLEKLATKPVWVVVEDVSA